MTTAQGGLPAVRRRTRTTVVHDTGNDDLPQVVREYVEQHFNGTWPTDPKVVLDFIRNHFSDRAYQEHRHRLMDRLLRSGMDVPEIAVLFAKAEGTIWVWKAAMTAWMSEAFGLADVRQIHLERMMDFSARLSRLDKIASDKDEPTAVRILAERTAISVHKMQDLVLAQSGYYQAYDMTKERPEDNEAARGTEALIEAIDEVLLAGASVVDVGSHDDHD